MRICHIEATVIAVLTGRRDRDNICSQSGNARISLSAVRFAASAPQFALATGRSRPRRRAIGCPGRGQASAVKQTMATDVTSLLRRFAARWIGTS